MNVPTDSFKGSFRHSSPWKLTFSSEISHLYSRLNRSLTGVNVFGDLSQRTFRLQSTNYLTLCQRPV